jgi:hypothetical protein
MANEGDKKINISLVSWEKTYALDEHETDFLQSLAQMSGIIKVNKEETTGNGMASNSGPKEPKKMKISMDRLTESSLEGLQVRREEIREEIRSLEGAKKKGEHMVAKLGAIMELKKELVENIDTVFSESSALLKKQRLLMLFSNEVDCIFKHFLINERVFYYNNMLKMSASESLSRSNIDSILE